MAKIIAVHSFRGGTGKTNITANLAAMMAAVGKRVGVIDTDLQSPGLHALFGLREEQTQRTLNDYLCGKCEIEQSAHDVTPNAEQSVAGRLFLIPSSFQAREVARLLREGYDVGRLNDGLQRLVKKLNLDILLVDTHPGLNEETLFSISVCNNLIVVMRPDRQDYQGTDVTVEVARTLDVPQLTMIINKVPAVFDAAAIKERAEHRYGCEVSATLSHSDEMMAMGSGGIFALRYPEHQLTTALKRAAGKLFSSGSRTGKLFLGTGRTDKLFLGGGYVQSPAG